MRNISPKIALITGAGGGIGSAIASQLCMEVDGLILVDLNQKKMNIIHDKIKMNSSASLIQYYCDVGKSGATEEMLQKATREIGTPNILINNAGIGGPFHRIDEVSDEEWHQIINTNLKGVFNLSKFLLPKMKEQTFGRIINIASIQGYLGAELSSTYVASKHGVIGYTKAIAAEWGKYGITCNAICPGYVDTTMGIQENKINDHYKKVIEKTPSNRLASPEEIAHFISFLIKDESSFINGASLTIDGGLSCHVGIT